MRKSCAMRGSATTTAVISNSARNVLRLRPSVIHRGECFISHAVLASQARGERTTLEHNVNGDYGSFTTEAVRSRWLRAVAMRCTASQRVVWQSCSAAFQIFGSMTGL